MKDPLKPSVQVLIALGSIAVHVDEATSSKAHHFDIIAAKSALETPGVREWIKAMDKLALLPLKRT